MADATVKTEADRVGPAADLPLDRDTLLADYRLAVESRQASLIGRREVFSGRAKFGIFGDGKELAQLAMAHAFAPGDFRSGYYRDQTFMFAAGMATIQEFFAQLYAHADVTADPHSAGRQMNAHFATRHLDSDGDWRPLAEMKCTAPDVSPTASQMPRLVGLAYASRLYREIDALHHLTRFSRQGQEIAWGTIGNASCAEGMFWEAVNAIGVLQAPAIISIWDDDYGISVPNEDQLVKGDLTELLQGFQRQPGGQEGFELYRVQGWDYPALVRVYQDAARQARADHVPAIIHVVEMTQPQGHSTSGSHQRYKSEARLAWEEEADCIYRMREWLLAQEAATAAELDAIEDEARAKVERIKRAAWQAYLAPLQSARSRLVSLMEAAEAAAAGTTVPVPAGAAQIRRRLQQKRLPQRRDLLAAAQQLLMALRRHPSPARERLAAWRQQQLDESRRLYGAQLMSDGPESPLQVPAVPAVYAADAPVVNGYEILNACFDAMLSRDPRLVAFGEDVGRLGGVNQTYAGLQEKHGALRVADTGIRETTIVGQAIGLALRGLRPIAEIQYLDYVLYALQIMSDDLATVRWRTAGGQKAPVIVSTRGHRLEGIWHAGSPMAGIIHLVRGMHVLVPRDMTRAAGFYNTLLLGDDPALVVEVLNGYRLKEKMPENIGEFTLPLGVPETLRAGQDVTVVTYGACCPIVLAAADRLSEVGIEAEVIDVQTLLPFDRPGHIVASLQRTSRVLFVDEDVPGGTTAYMMQEVIEKQGGFWWLDSEPRTLSAQPHRPAYGSDGAHFSKPNVEAVFDAVYDIMSEAEPSRYPPLYQ